VGKTEDIKILFFDIENSPNLAGKVCYTRVSMPITYKCEVCGVSKTVPPSTYKRGGKFCSRQCNGKNLENKYGGKKKCTKCKVLKNRDDKNFYKNRTKSDGLTTECQECCKRVTILKVEARQNFVIKNGCKCNKCGLGNKDPSFFDVDHIKSVSSMGIKRGDLDFKDNNLQILCPNCHRIKTIHERSKN